MKKILKIGDKLIREFEESKEDLMNEYLKYDIDMQISGIKTYQDKIKHKLAQLEKELSSEMARFNVQKKEIEAVANLKEELGKQGLDLQTLLKLGKEFSLGNIKD